MALYLVLLPFVLAFSLASTNLCVSPPGPSIDLSLHSRKNASGHWIITVDTRRFTMKENPRELTVNVHQETRSCDSNEIEQLVSVAFVYPSLQGTSISGAMEPNLPSITTANFAASTTTNTTPFTTNSTTPSTASDSGRKSCPHSGYQLFPEFNCYKAFPSEDEMKTWSDAREQCRRDGGDLMVMETEREWKEVYIPLYNSVEFYTRPWVGVHIPPGGDGWMTVKGEPVLIIWWTPGEPDKDAARSCTDADDQGLLRNYNCGGQYPFICEIPL